MHSFKSILLTLLCAVLILCLGYLGIVETGRQILKGESLPEQAEYENVGSNIFYGKIEDDVEIFPWNYYAKSGQNLEKGIPELLVEGIVAAQYGMVDYVAEEDRIVAVDGYFGQLISYQTGVDIADVMEWFEKNDKHILYNMSVAREDTTVDIYLYQVILQLGGRIYPVQIACGEMTLMSFSFIAYDSIDHREQEAWKLGKEKMISVLEQSEQSLAEYFVYMTDLFFVPVSTYAIEDKSTYAIEDNTYEIYENLYIQGFYWLDTMIQQEVAAEELAQNIKEWRMNWEEKTWGDKLISEGEVEEMPSYTYQVVELKDRILLLMQGQNTIGIFYDPIAQKFCGYNYFYE